MTIYVDDLKRYKSGLWCHMMSDQGVDDLVLFAASIGVKIEYLQNHPLHPHFDLRPNKRALAVARGAISISTFEMARRCSKYFNPKE